MLRKALHRCDSYGVYRCDSYGVCRSPFTLPLTLGPTIASRRTLNSHNYEASGCAKHDHARLRIHHTRTSSSLPMVAGTQPSLSVGIPPVIYSLVYYC